MEKRKKILAAAGGITAAITVWFVWDSFMFIRSDNAQIDGHIVVIASKVPGFVVEVKADLGDQVKAGDILARIDDRDFSTSVDRAKADVDSSTARLTDAEKNHGRLSSLFSKGAASQAQFDAATSALNELKGRFSAAKAQLDLAKINLEYATIRAPFDGFVAKRSAEVGQFVGVGSPLFGFVDSAERWVTANLKETEISGVESGSRVDVRVDAIPGRTYPGTVKQLSASTGAAFTLIPPDNATGNFTKVVQRVPVKISLDEVSAEDARLLKAGLSADVRIHRRKWW